MAVTFKDDGMKKAMETAKLNQDTKDNKLIKKIAGVLGTDGHQRVLLAGEAGIGKTRLAKMVGKYVIDTRVCFLTICVHLNNKFVDELSLYENIASQLCVYSDFEETEVDDRDEDEDEEKDDAALLTDLKKKIIEEIEKKREAADKYYEEDKAKKNAAEKKARDEKAAKEAANKNTTTAGKDKQNIAEAKSNEEEKIKGTSSTGEPYLLLILDDEGIKAAGEDKDTSEDKDTTENKDTTGDKVTNEDKDTIEEEVTNKDPVALKNKVTNKDKVTSEDWVMKGLKFEEFLRNQKFLTDYENKRLKIITTKRKGDEEPAKNDEKAKSTDAKSEEEDGSHSGEGEEEGNKDDEDDSDGGIKTEDKDNKGNPDPQDEAQLAKPDGDVATLSEADPKCYDEIVFNTTDASKALLATIDDPNLKDLFFSLVREHWKNDEELRTAIMTKSRNSPAAIVVLAKSLVVLAKSLERIAGTTSDSKGKEELQEKIDKKIQEVLSMKPTSTSDNTINPIMHLAYELLKFYDDRLKGAILDCFWHSLDFFEHCGCVYYRDLITQWILEGYFDPVRSVEKAYQDGHLILMELINRGMLKIQENNVVVPERAMSTLIDPRRRGLFGRSRLRFSGVYRGDKRKGLGKITQIDDMIKTVQAKKGDKMTTILVSGDRLRRVTPEKYFAELDGLEVLGMFEPTLEPFVPDLLKGAENRAPLKTLFKLRVLVIRDCDLLNGIEELKALQELQALEVSGASSLKEISGDFFTALPKLQSLHLSGLQIESSPHSISQLTELHCLIIKDCPFLKDLPDIQELVKLEVVDISGAHGLQTCFDNTPGEKKNKSKNKNFYHLTKLQLLDFSESQIERLPIFQDSAEAKPLHSVTRLLLRNCSKLRRLPSLKPLSGLQILDLSGTTSLVEMLEVCFEHKKELKSLNLSGTNLSELATTIEELTSLTELLLKNCTNLEAIPNITPLANLEVIDVSGSTKLNKIEVSFEEMCFLREVNLSGTKVETPKLPNTSNIDGLKCITLADGTYLEGKNWDEVKAKMPSQGSDGASSSGAVVRSEIQPIEPSTTDCTENGHVSEERLLQVPKEKLYKTTLSYFGFALQMENKEIMEINETNEVAEEALATAQFVSFVECSSTRFISIFNKTKSVKGCWLRMCPDIKDLFSAVVVEKPGVDVEKPGVDVEKSGVDVERLELLETLSITSLPLLVTISCGSSLKNLKKLSIFCCPNIITLFPEASQFPSTLKDLHVEHCEKLEKVPEGVELSTFTDLKVKNCPKFEKDTSVVSDWVMIDPQG